MSLRPAAYAVCVEDGRVLLARFVWPDGESVAHGLTGDPGGTPRPELRLPDVTHLRRSGLVDIVLALARSLPATGHVDPVPVGGLVQH
jgi:hypothetical protein